MISQDGTKLKPTHQVGTFKKERDFDLIPGQHTINYIINAFRRRSNYNTTNLHLTVGKQRF